MKKLIILIEIIIITLLLIASGPKVESQEQKFFIMTVTAYSLHPDCIADKWNDGYTATMTPIRKGVAAINVDYIDGKWTVKSPLKLGDKIYIEGLGNFSIEDTGRFAERDYIQDMWTVDIYMESYEEAVIFGRQPRRVFVINN
jgi:3D (Asp-Asp-Asp) domain-containing protein